jgi:transposase InsO family protein
MVSPDAKRRGVAHLVKMKAFSQRHACHLVGVARSTTRYQRRRAVDEAALAEAMQEQVQRHPVYGYRPITALLRRQGWQVNHKRVYRLWRMLGLQLPRRAKRKRQYGAAPERLQRAERPNHVWTYDFLHTSTERGGKLRILAVLDEYTRECLALFVGRSISSTRVIHLLHWLFVTRGRPAYLRSDNGPEFVARAVQMWLEDEKCQTLYIKPGSPWENPFIESFNGKLRAECLDRYLYVSTQEAQQLVDDWRQEYNEERPHSALGYLSPSTFANQVNATLAPTGT